MLILVLGLGQSVNTLYTLTTLEYNPTSYETPVVLRGINVLTNETSLVMEFNLANVSFIYGTAFDQYNKIYYVSYVIQDPGPPQSYLSAIDVDSASFIFENMIFSPHHPVLWDIDIDSFGRIHYLRSGSAKTFHDYKAVVDYCIWDPKLNTTNVVVEAAALVSLLGSLSYDEAKETILVVDAFGITSIVSNGQTTYFPYADNVLSEGSIQWNNITNTGYILEQLTGTPTIQRIVKYIPFTNIFEPVCTITTPDETWIVSTSISDAGALDPTNNFYSLVVNSAALINEPSSTIIVTMDLNTCTQYMTKYPNGAKVRMGGPEYSYQ